MLQPTYKAIILQAAAPAIAPPDMGIGGLEQYGLLGMVGLLVAKEALSWFRKKEDSESKLVETLVADLRRTQEQLISKLFDLHVQQHQDLGEVKEALHDIRDRLDKLV